jgi:hypothetical protein
MRAPWMLADPDFNWQFRRRWVEPNGPKQSSRTRGPCPGRGAFGGLQRDDAPENTARRRSPQWLAAERALFGRVGPIGAL